MPDSPYVQLVDTSASPTTTPVTNRVGQAVNSTAQGGIVSLGADANGICRTPKVDSSGNQYVVQANPAGNATQFYSSQTSPAASAQYGNLLIGRQDLPSPSTMYALNLDPLMALNVHPKSKPTFTCVAQSVTATLNATMISVWNGSTMLVRIQQIWVYVPPSGLAGTLLGGSSATYYPVRMEIRRYTTAFTAGNSITPYPFDTADTLAGGIAAASGSTVGTATATLHRFDAVQSTDAGLPYYGRSDPNAKVIVVRPGEGIAVICVDAGTINNANASGTTQAKCDLDLSFTQAAA